MLNHLAHKRQDYLRTPPLLADVTDLLYRSRMPLFTLCSGMLHTFRRLASSFSSTERSTLLDGISTWIVSPFSTSPIGPPTAASGETCPMHGPRVPPLNLPSVTTGDRFAQPHSCNGRCQSQHLSHSWATLRPSYRMTTTFPALTSPFIIPAMDSSSEL